jgi:Saccharopine dehydrogenase NADP binding domain
MKLVKTFTRRVKTSRRFVFENILDLDHVCVVHRKWFRNLRIRTWGKDLVSYRLQSRFYGLKQDVEVSGGPIDADRYWYEFNGPIARIRVDGVLSGPDGDLTQTETITYRFHWMLAPLFWLLSPLFKRQKDDILHDDMALLERVHAMDQQGFERTEAAAEPRIVVYGGAGFFGHELVKDLLENTNASIVVASRNPVGADYGRHAPRVKCWISDLDDRDSVDALIDGARVAICATGPFQGLAPRLLEACIRKRVHYVDIADDRGFVERAHAIRDDVERAGIAAFVGCSVVPGISAILARFARSRLPDARRVKICITPGTRHPRGAASFRCLLSTVGRPYLVPRGGELREIVGWTERERLDFPAPLGKRHVYSVVDIADYFTQPRYLGFEDVTFKIGAELDALNRLLALFRVGRRSGLAGEAGALVAFFRRVIGVAALFGTTEGGVIVEVVTADGPSSRRFAVAITKQQDGHIIPAILASLAAQLLLGEAPAPRGIVPPPDWLPFEALQVELVRRGVTVSTRSDVNDWVVLPATCECQDARRGAIRTATGRPRSA